MITAVRALMTHAIDYAGLFPPAALTMPEALRQYASYRDHRHVWMLGPFVCPAGRLPEIEPLVGELFTTPEPWQFSLLMGGGANAEEFRTAFGEGNRTLRVFHDKYKTQTAVPAFEIKLPADVVTPAGLGQLDSLLQVVRLQFVENGYRDAKVFFEASFPQDWRTHTGAVIDAIAKHRTWAGFKLRTGGVNAEAFPSIEQVAFTIARCRDHKLPWKATAGLHHPLRHLNEHMMYKMHGFLNMFMATAMAMTHHFSEERIADILAEEAPAAFQFHASGAVWHEHGSSIDQILAARRQALISFGCCSFEEPVDDLTILGLLEK